MLRIFADEPGDIAGVAVRRTSQGGMWQEACWVSSSLDVIKKLLVTAILLPEPKVEYPQSS